MADGFVGVMCAFVAGSRSWAPLLGIFGCRSHFTPDVMPLDYRSWFEVRHSPGESTFLLD
jgi:hypothetical protein